MPTLKEIDRLRYENAEKALSMALAYSQRHKSSPEATAVLGSCYRSVGQIQLAQRTLWRAVHLAPEDSVVLGDCLQRLAYVSIDANELNSAEKMIRASVVLFAELTETAKMGQALFDLGVVYYMRQNFEATLRCNFAALVHLDGSDLSNRFSAHLGNALALLKLDRMDEALGEALEADKLGGATRHLAHRALELVIEIETKAGDFRSAWKHAELLANRYANAGRHYDAPLAAIWSLKLRVQGGLAAEASALAPKLLTPTIYQLDDDCSRLILDLIRTTLEGGDLSLQQLEHAHSALRELSAARMKRIDPSRPR